MEAKKICWRVVKEVEEGEGGSKVGRIGARGDRGGREKRWRSKRCRIASSNGCAKNSDSTTPRSKPSSTGASFPVVAFLF